jgi:pimeloyl-ACP methyl ester carboxylesterase
MAIDAESCLYFEEFGAQNPKTIVFLHGGGVGGWMWRGQVSALQNEYHCLIPDLPEQGHNMVNGTGPFEIETAADRIATLIRGHAHTGRAHVVGLSEGAQVTVALLARQPRLVDHAVVSSASLRAIPGGRFYSRGLFVWSYRLFMAPFRKNDWWIRLNMQSSAGLSDAFYPEFKLSFQQTTQDSFVNMMVASTKFRQPLGLENADLPVLVIVGSKEYKEMKASAKDLLHSLPRARGVMVTLGEKSSLAKEHNWAVTAPNFFTETVKAWIENQPLPQKLLPLE